MNQDEQLNSNVMAELAEKIKKCEENTFEYPGIIIIQYNTINLKLA